MMLRAVFISAFTILVAASVNLGLVSLPTSDPGTSFQAAAWAKTQVLSQHAEDIAREEERKVQEARARRDAASASRWSAAAQAHAEAEAARRAAEEAERARKAAAEAKRKAAAAAAPAAPHGVWDRLAECESNGEWDYGPHSGWGSGIYEGGLQFHPRTWDAYKPAGYPEAAYQASREQQILVAERVLADQGWGAWPACSRKLGLR